MDMAMMEKRKAAMKAPGDVSVMIAMHKAKNMKDEPEPDKARAMPDVQAAIGKIKAMKMDDADREELLSLLAAPDKEEAETAMQPEETPEEIPALMSKK